VLSRDIDARVSKVICRVFRPLSDHSTYGLWRRGSPSRHGNGQALTTMRPSSAVDCAIDLRV
jgi:hypothetical protein